VLQGPTDPTPGIATKEIATKKKKKKRKRVAEPNPDVLDAPATPSLSKSQKKKRRKNNRDANKKQQQPPGPAVCRGQDYLRKVGRAPIAPSRVADARSVPPSRPTD
jgi:hypothetical protein